MINFSRRREQFRLGIGLAHDLSSYDAEEQTIKDDAIGMIQLANYGGGLWTMKKRNYSKGNGGYLRRKEHPNKIRNGKIRRDFKRLLEIIADGREPHFPEVEEIAGRHADRKSTRLNSSHVAISYAVFC